jgi:hypothetical protein
LKAKILVSVDMQDSASHLLEKQLITKDLEKEIQ